MWTYEGEWNQGVKEGQGEIILECGTIYTGSFYANQMHGFGKYVSSEGWVYEGDFVSGIREGQGLYTFVNGSTYDGQWVNGVEQGHGIYQDITGWSYEGQWYAGRKEGMGLTTYESGATHHGMFENNQPHGHGIRTYFDENGFYFATYEGYFAYGRRDGFGTMTYVSGTIISGQWANDNFID